MPWGSISEVIVSGPTQVMRAGQSRTASVSRTSAAGHVRAARHLAGRARSGGAGSARVTGAPARAVATDPSGSKETTTTGVAPPDQATSAIRRTAGSPSASASAESGLAARMTAATVIGPV